MLTDVSCAILKTDIKGVHKLISVRNKRPHKHMSCIHSSLSLCVKQQQGKQYSLIPKNHRQHTFKRRRDYLQKMWNWLIFLYCSRPGIPCGWTVLRWVTNAKLTCEKVSMQIFPLFILFWLLGQSGVTKKRQNSINALHPCVNCVEVIDLEPCRCNEAFWKINKIQPILRTQNN